jgi:cytoskeletal protein CcmA (bactofilin family)
MFKETKRPVGTDTLIGQGTQAEGKMISDTGIRIEGEYRGDIECKGDVIVGECGIAKSNITAKDLTVAGRVFGDVVTTGRLTITASGQVHGNITAHALFIQEGGVLNGTCQMERPAEHKSRPAAPETDRSIDSANKEQARQAV